MTKFFLGVKYFIKLIKTGLCKTIQLSETTHWSSIVYGLKRTNQFFLVNGVGTRDKRLKDEGDTYNMKFDTIITPLDKNGVPLGLQYGKIFIIFLQNFEIQKSFLLILKNYKKEIKNKI